MMLAFSAWSKPIEPTQAAHVAANFWKYNSLGKWEGMADISSSVGIAELYVFANPEGGFIIVSADDCALPILGYSATSVFLVPLPSNVQDWLNGYAWEIRQLVQHAVQPSQQVTAEWKRYRESETTKTTLTTVVAPLLTTTWSQGTYYNNLCPVDASTNQHTATGCVATAEGPVISGGVVQKYFVNTYMAGKLQMEPTNEEATRPAVLPWPEKGLDRDAILRLCGEGILVTEFNGGNCNSATGDFSYGIEGLYFKDGKAVKPVSGMIVTGNFLDLWSRFLAAGEDARPCATKLIPTLAFGEVDFSG